MGWVIPHVGLSAIRSVTSLTDKISKNVTIFGIARLHVSPVPGEEKEKKGVALLVVAVVRVV